MIFNGVQTYGLQFLPSGLFSVIVYLQPVLVVLLAWLWLKESLTVVKIVGMIIGFLGVVAVVYEGVSGQVSFYGILLALTTGLGWAIGTVYVKKTSRFGQWTMARCDSKYYWRSRFKWNWDKRGECIRYSMESDLCIHSSIWSRTRGYRCYCGLQ